MKTMLPEFLSLGGWALISILLTWLTLTRVWSQIIGERDVNANLMIMGVTIFWGITLSLWL